MLVCHFCLFSQTSAEVKKSDNSACVAGSHAGPNAVCQVLLKDGRQVNFGYDRRGNQLTGDG
ncbi:hypothetical protein QE250_16990, partial [Chromatiaceae bacterium AAb-1]|nr:hypothetical protein [Chromatiaceae bacterium AAb-1]